MITMTAKSARTLAGGCGRFSCLPPAPAHARTRVDAIRINRPHVPARARSGADPLDLAMLARARGRDLTDLVMQFEERAAIREYDGNKPRAEAEAAAWA